MQRLISASLLRVTTNITNWFVSFRFLSKDRRLAAAPQIFAVTIAALICGGIAQAQQAPRCVANAACQLTSTSLEFRHKATGVYFMTACSNEIAVLDANPLLFERTGQTLPVNAVAAAPTLDTMSRYLFGPVASPVALPTRHFYTAIKAENDQLASTLAQLANPAVACLEATDLGFVSAPTGLTLDNSTPPKLIAIAENISCPAGTAPVWRAYNEVVPQHRFTSSYSFLNSSILPDTQATSPSAWKNEGVKFCIPSVKSVFTVTSSGGAPAVAAGGLGTLNMAITNSIPSATTSGTTPVLRLALPANLTATVAGYSCTNESGSLASGLLVACSLTAIAGSTPLTVVVTLTANTAYVTSGTPTLRATVAPTDAVTAEYDPSACLKNATPYIGCFVQTLSTPPTGGNGALPAIASLTFEVLSQASGNPNQANIRATFLSTVGSQNLLLYAQSRSAGGGAWESAGAPNTNPFQVAQPVPQALEFSINPGNNGGSREVRLCTSTTALFDLRSACGDNTKTIVSDVKTINFGQVSVPSLQVYNPTLATSVQSGQALGAFQFSVWNAGSGPATGLTCGARLNTTGSSSSCSLDSTSLSSLTETTCRCSGFGAVNSSGVVTLTASGDGGLTASNSVGFTVTTPVAGEVTQITINKPVITGTASSSSGNSATLTMTTSNPSSTITGTTLKVFYASSPNVANNLAAQADFSPSSTLSIASGSDSKVFTLAVPSTLTAGYFKVCLLNQGTSNWQACGSTTLSKESAWSDLVSFGPPPPPPAAATVTFSAAPGNLTVGTTASYDINAVSTTASALLAGPLTLSIALPSNMEFVPAGSSSGCALAPSNNRTIQCSLLTVGSLPATVGETRTIVVRPLSGAGGTAQSVVALVAGAGTTSISCTTGTSGCKTSSPLTPAFYDLTAPTSTIQLPTSTAPVNITCGKTGTVIEPATAACSLLVTYSDLTTLTTAAAPKLYVSGVATITLCASGTSSNTSCTATLDGAKTVKTIAVTAASNETPVNYENSLTNNSFTVYTSAPPPPTCTNQAGAANVSLNGNVDFGTPSVDAFMSGQQVYVIELIPGPFMATLGRNQLNLLSWNVRSGSATREVSVSPCRGDFTSTAAQRLYLGGPNDAPGDGGGFTWLLDEPNRTAGVSFRTARITSDRNYYVNFRNTSCLGSSYGPDTCVMYWFAVPAGN